MAELLRRNFRNITIFLCALIRVGLYGFAFFPVLDDWIQYGTFAQTLHPWRDLFIGGGLYTFRPISWIMDIFIWSRIAWLLPLIIVTMHAASCILFIRVARKSGLNIGMVFVIIYMFLPINSEATMWMSAATRLIVPVFFMSIALNLAIGKRNKRNIFLFWITQLLSVAFYEQVAMISIFLCILIGLRLRRKYLSQIAFGNAAIIAIYYAAFLAKGPALERTGLEGTLWQQITVFVDYFTYAWFGAHWELFTNGLMRGARLLQNHLAYAALIVCVTTVFALGTLEEFAHEPEHTQVPNQRKTKIILGSILFVLPFIPFLLMSGNMLAFRNCFPSLIGLGLILDGLIDYIPKVDFFKPIGAGVFVLIFMIVGVSELSDYRAVSLTDKAFAEGIIPQTMQEWLMMDRIPNLVQELNTVFGEHIMSVTSSGWALTGCVRNVSGNLALPVVKVIWNTTGK